MTWSFVFFKQKTAYEMRISDWSSDVCSSDLLAQGYDRLLQKTLAARPAVLLFGGAVLIAIVILFTGARRELAPQEDQGYVFVATKGPQYANIDRKSVV